MTRFHRAVQVLKLFTVVGTSLALAACVAPTETTADGRANAETGRDPVLVRLVETCRRLHKADNLLLAIGICRRAHEVALDDPVPLVDLGALYGRMGKHDEAIAAYQGAIARDDALVEPRLGLGKSLIALQRYDQARVQLEAAFARDSSDPRIYSAIGVIDDMAGDHVAAQANYRTGLERAPDDVALRNNLALSLTLGGAADQAIEILRAIVDSGASNDTSRQNLALAHKLRDERQIADTADRIHRAWDRAWNDAWDEVEDVEPRDLAVADAIGEIEAIQLMPAGGPEIEASDHPMPLPAPAERIAAAASKPLSPSDGEVPALARGAAEARGFTVQLAAYHSHANAVAGWRRLQAGGDDLFDDVDKTIKQVDHGAERGVFFRLAVGRFDDRHAAASFCASLKDREIDCIVTKG